MFFAAAGRALHEGEDARVGVLKQHVQVGQQHVRRSPGSVAPSAESLSTFRIRIRMCVRVKRQLPSDSALQHARLDRLAVDEVGAVPTSTPYAEVSCG